MMAFSTADIERAHAQHKLAVLMGVEGGHSIEKDLGLLRDFYRLGVRYMTLTWSNPNEWADSSGDLGDLTVIHHALLERGYSPADIKKVLGENMLRVFRNVEQVSRRLPPGS
jgi:membrane dipeptidase